jgi:hypothetical protein
MAHDHAMFIQSEALQEEYERLANRSNGIDLSLYFNRTVF